MSKKDLAIKNMLQSIGAIQTPAIGKVSDAPVDFAKLAKTAYPFIQLEIQNEERQDITMSQRLCTMYVGVTAHVKSEARGVVAANVLSELHAAIELSLEADRTRGGVALLTELREVNDVTEGNYPLVSQTYVYVIQYYHDRGNN
jgi:hypothetical protein